MDKIIVVGGGGHAKVVIDILEAQGEFTIVGVLDPGQRIGERIVGFPVLGGDEMLPALARDGVHCAAIGIGGIRDTLARGCMYDKLEESGFRVPALVHPFSHVSPHALLAEGVQVVAGSVVQPCARIGKNTLVNTRAIVGHDCQIGKHVHLAPGAILGGGVTLGDGVFVGSGAKILQGVHVCTGSCIGAGAVVLKNIDVPGTYIGVPARPTTD